MNKLNNERAPLEELVEAFVNLPIPEGPEVEVKQRLLETLTHADDIAETIRPVSFWRGKTMRKIIGSAAMVLVFVSVVSYFQPPPTGGPGAAFAAMLREIKEIRTATFIVKARIDDGPEVTGRSSLLEPSWVRQEMMMDGKVKAVQVFNLRDGSLLSLMPEQKKAILLDISGIPEKQRQESIVESFKKMTEDAAEFVGEEEMEGTTTLKYNVDQQGLSFYAVWLDLETKMPVKILITDHADPAKSKMHITMTDFDWGAKVDESLFTLEVPEGYELLEQSLDLGGSSEKDFAAMLRIYVRLNDNAFPDEWNVLTVASIGRLMKKSEGTDEEKKQYAMKKLAQALGKPELADTMSQMELGMQLQQPFGRGAAFFAALTETHHCHYQGKGVKLGEADKIVFWWYPREDQADEGADLEMAHVLYGDLRIETMPVEELPRPE